MEVHGIPKSTHFEKFHFLYFAAGQYMRNTVLYIDCVLGTLLNLLLVSVIFFFRFFRIFYVNKRVICK